MTCPNLLAASYPVTVNIHITLMICFDPPLFRRTNVPEDQNRSFIITFYKADRTVVVREPPKRNSGIVGGNFLSRMKVRDTCDNVITEGYFYVGAEITIHGHCFRVTGADDKTLRLMEERSAEFPNSDPIRAAKILGGYVERRTDLLRAELRDRDIQVGTEDKYYTPDRT